MYVEFGADEVSHYGSVGFTWDIMWWGEVGDIKVTNGWSRLHLIMDWVGAGAG